MSEPSTGTHWVALLRGINVGGINIKMVELAELFRGLGFSSVRTVLASGNVLFSSESTDAAALVARIESALSERFGYNARIVLITREYLARVVDAFPFDAAREGWHPYVLFSNDPAVLDDLHDRARGLDQADDVIARGDGVIYWHNRRERGVESAFSKLSAKLKTSSTGAVVTNRNLRTLVKLLR